MEEQKEFIETLHDAIRKHQTIIFSCECEVTYNGRAESYLPKGELIIIIKNDQTLLVHQPLGSMPVNHLRMGGTHWIEKDKGKIYLKSEHKKHKEELLITIHNIKFYHTETLNDDKKIMTKGTEKDMSEMLYKNPSMIEKGLKPLSREEHTKFGFIDVFGYDNEKNLVVIECKRQKADLQAVTQLRRYVNKMKKEKGITNVRGILASPTITKNALEMIKEYEYKWVSVEPPRFNTVRNKKQTELHHF